jgi:hypothetical protein
MTVPGVREGSGVTQFTLPAHGSTVVAGGGVHVQVGGRVPHSVEVEQGVAVGAQSEFGQGVAVAV